MISAAAWVYLVTAHGGFWLTSQRLPQGAARSLFNRAGVVTVPGTGVITASGAGVTAAPEPRAATGPVGAGDGSAARAPLAWPPVAAVVPARNEAGILPVTLPALLAQAYPGEFRVFLVDDNSDDGTGAVAAGLGEKAARDGGAPLTVVKGRPRPDGWAGKVWAMAQGFAAATERGAGALPEYVLFTDADISWAPHALRDLVRGAEADDRALVSQMALLRAETGWERVIVPAFVYFFAQLYPFRKVNDPNSRTAGAAGGCMLIRRAALENAGGLTPISGALIDDVALGTLLKRHGNRTWLGLSTDVRSARPYPDLASLWHMIARSAYVQLRYNPLLLAGTLAGLLVLYAAPVAGTAAALVAAATGNTGSGTVLAGLAGVAGWALMTVSYLPMLRLYGLSALRAPTLPVIAALYAAMTADSARRHYSGRAVSWRGRTASRV